MARRILPIIAVFLLVTTVAFAILWGLTQRRYSRVRIAVEELSGFRENRVFQDSLRVLAARLSMVESNGTFWYSEAKRARENQAMLLTETDIRKLKKVGLHDPVNELRRDLVAHPELIPYKGVLGGTMQFVGDRVALLSTRWVFAEFEDGHIGGSCLLEYEITPEGCISWKLLSAALH